MVYHEIKSWYTLINGEIINGQLCSTNQTHMLTKREIEVLQLISQELTTEQIASQLQVSVPTIETHRHNLFQKLRVKSVVGLIKEAIRQGLIENP